MVRGSPYGWVRVVVYARCVRARVLGIWACLLGEVSKSKVPRLTCTYTWGSRCFGAPACQVFPITCYLLLLELAPVSRLFPEGASGNASPDAPQVHWVGGVEPSTLGPSRPWSTCRGSTQLPAPPHERSRSDAALWSTSSLKSARRGFHMVTMLIARISVPRTSQADLLDLFELLLCGRTSARR